jgi:hypothetical protein
MSETPREIVDIEWLRELEVDLWPPDHKHNVFSMKVSRELTKAELKHVFRIIKEHKLLTHMFSAGMFGKYGMEIAEHPPCPGAPRCPCWLSQKTICQGLPDTRF